MKENIISFAHKSQNGKAWDVKQMLQDAVSDLETGSRKANKAVIVFLDDNDGRYHTGFSQSASSQCVALLEIAKIEFIKTIGY